MAAARGASQSLGAGSPSPGAERLLIKRYRRTDGAGTEAIELLYLANGLVDAPGGHLVAAHLEPHLLLERTVPPPASAHVVR